MSDEKSDEPYLKVNFKQNGGEFDFKDDAQLSAFLTVQAEHWTFIDELDPANKDAPLKGVAARLKQRTASAVQAAKQFSRGEITKTDLRNNLEGAFADDGVGNRTPIATSAEAQFLSGMAASFSDGAVLAAISIATANAQQTNWNNRIHAIGMNAYLNFLAGVSSEAADAASNSMIQTAKAYKERFYDDTSEIDKLIHKADALTVNMEKAKHVGARWVAHEWDKYRSKAQSQLDEKVAEFENTERTYREFMALKAPSEYWEKKADGHDARTIAFGIVSLVWALAGGGFLWWRLQVIYTSALGVAQLSGNEQIAGPTALWLVLGAQGLVLTTIVLWVGRIFVRLFLSELHLAMDARERVTMVQSYLALSEEGGKVAENNLSIVLEALFRPTQDGIVKDDASADPTLAAALSRIVSPTR